MSRYSVTAVPDYFRPILLRIERLFDAAVSIDSFDDEWVNFSVVGLADNYAILQLETNKFTILPGPDMQKFQILCNSDSSAGEGLWLHHLADAKACVEYRSGMWFY